METYTLKLKGIKPDITECEAIDALVKLFELEEHRAVIYLKNIPIHINGLWGEDALSIRRKLLSFFYIKIKQE